MDKIIKLLVPEKLEALLYFLLGFILIIVVDIKLFISYLTASSGETIDSLGYFKNVLLAKIFSLEQYIDPRFVDVLVWALLGSVIIMIILVVEASIASAKEEEQLLKYLSNPDSKSQETKLFIIKLTIRIAAIVGLIFYIRTFFLDIVPLLAANFFISVTSLKLLEPVLLALVCPFLAAIGIYIFAIFARLIALRPRVFSKDF
jgi:hypothetical protein